MTSFSGASVLRVGAIGADSSHLAEFSCRMADLHAAGGTRCLVTHFHDLEARALRTHPASQTLLPKAEKWREQVLALGARETRTIDELLQSVDAVMVLNRDGHRHFDLAVRCFERGKPTFVDKPLTCSFDQAGKLLNLARTTGARCWSASALRFAPEIGRIPRAELGRIVAVDAFGGGETCDLMPGLWFYGCHTIEMVDAIWGPGVERVRAVSLPDRFLVDLGYGDGRTARLRLERRGMGQFGATVHGERGVHHFVVDFGPVYAGLVGAITAFFEGRKPAVQLDNIVESIGVMQAGNESIARDGAWTQVGQSNLTGSGSHTPSPTHPTAAATDQHRPSI